MNIETTSWDLETRHTVDAYILMMPFFFPFYRTFRIVRAAKLDFTVSFNNEFNVPPSETTGSQ